MTVGVGVIGTGHMGLNHIRMLTSEVSDAAVVAVCDVDRPRAEFAADEAGGAGVFENPDELIRDDDVDAVLIASPSDVHVEFTTAAVKAGKQVLCEKPMATTTAGAMRILEAEARTGRRLVQVGFMRRCDPGYASMKAAVDSGSLGDALVMHCVHRNPEGRPGFTSEMHSTDALIHEIDIARWLLGSEFVGVTVYKPRSARNAEAGLSDPQFMVLEAETGALVDVEIFCNAVYGYEVRCELVCETGTVSLRPPAPVAVRSAGQNAASVEQDYLPRFANAYRLELQRWIRGAERGEPDGPSAWDGYAATAVAEACLRSLATGARSDVRLEPRPEFYLPAPEVSSLSPAFATGSAS